MSMPPCGCKWQFRIRNSTRMRIHLTTTLIVYSCVIVNIDFVMVSSGVAGLQLVGLVGVIKTVSYWCCLVVKLQLLES